MNTPRENVTTHEYLWVTVVVAGERPSTLDLVQHGQRSPWPATRRLRVATSLEAAGWRLEARTESVTPEAPAASNETLTGLSELAVAEHLYRMIHALVSQEADAQGWGRLHAAAVDIGDRRVLVAGPSGAGKTTMARELARRGHALQSDEAVLIKGGLSVGLPRRIHIKESPDTPLISPSEDHDVVRLDYAPVILAIPPGPAGRALTVRPIHAIVLLGERGHGDQQLELRRASSSEAFVALTSEASWFSPGALAVSTVSQVLQAVPVWHLSGHEALSGADALEGLAR